MEGADTSLSSVLWRPALEENYDRLQAIVAAAAALRDGWTEGPAAKDAEDSCMLLDAGLGTRID